MNTSNIRDLVTALAFVACGAWGLNAVVFWRLVNEGALSGIAFLAVVLGVLSLLVAGLRVLFKKSGKVAFSIGLVLSVLAAITLHGTFWLPSGLCILASVAGVGRAVMEGRGR